MTIGLADITTQKKKMRVEKLKVLLMHQSILSRKTTLTYSSTFK